MCKGFSCFRLCRMRITGGFSGFAGCESQGTGTLIFAALLSLFQSPWFTSSSPHDSRKKIKFRPLGVPLFRRIPRDWVLFPGKIMAYYFKVLIIIRTFASQTRWDAMANVSWSAKAKRVRIHLPCTTFAPSVKTQLYKLALHLKNTQQTYCLTFSTKNLKLWQ